jgi:hypothetical protein
MNQNAQAGKAQRLATNKRRDVYAITSTNDTRITPLSYSATGKRRTIGRCSAGCARPARFLWTRKCAVVQAHYL